MFKIGDRVITNQKAFGSNQDPEAHKWRGVKGTIVGGSLAFDWNMEVDEPVDGVEVTTWPVNSKEIDLLED